MQAQTVDDQAVQAQTVHDQTAKAQVAHDQAVHAAAAHDQAVHAAAAHDQAVQAQAVQAQVADDQTVQAQVADDQTVQAQVADDQTVQAPGAQDQATISSHPPDSPPPPQNPDGTESAEFIRYAAQSFSAPFDRTPEVSRTWIAAREAGDGTYASTRQHFWSMVNSGETGDAQVVGRILSSAGYELGTGSTAPVLSTAFLGEWSTPDQTHEIKGRELTSPANSENLERADRLLTIDHAHAQSKDAELRVDESNLRFMSGHDNSIRGNRWGADDVPTDEQRAKAGLPPRAG